MAIIKIAKNKKSLTKILLWVVVAAVVFAVLAGAVYYMLRAADSSIIRDSLQATLKQNNMKIDVKVHGGSAASESYDMSLVYERGKGAEAHAKMTAPRDGFSIITATNWALDQDGDMFVNLKSFGLLVDGKVAADTSQYDEYDDNTWGKVSTPTHDTFYGSQACVMYAINKIVSRWDDTVHYMVQLNRAGLLGIETVSEQESIKTYRMTVKPKDIAAAQKIVRKTPLYVSLTACGQNEIAKELAQNGKLELQVDTKARTLQRAKLWSKDTAVVEITFEQTKQKVTAAGPITETTDAPDKDNQSSKNSGVLFTIISNLRQGQAGN